MIRIQCGQCNKSYREDEERTHKCNIKKYKHLEEVKYWSPHCRCMQYCYMIGTFNRHDRMVYIETGHISSTIQIQSSIIKYQGWSQGQTRPIHCSKSASSHPGYKRIHNNYLNNIFYLIIRTLHKGPGRKPESKRYRQI